MVPCEKILQTAREHERRHDRPVGPDHAVARRDGPRRPGDGARGLRGPAADRRGDDQRQAHGRQDRAGLSRAGRPRQGRLALRRRGRSAHPPRARGRARPREPRRCRSRSARASPHAGSASSSPTPRRCDAGSRSTGPSAPIAVPVVPRARGCSRDFPLERARAVHRLVAVLHGLGAEGQVSADLRRPRGRRGGARAVRRRPARCSTGSSREAADGARRLRLLPGQRRRRRHRRLHRRVADRGAGAVPDAAAAVGARGPDDRSAAWPTTSPRSASGRADYLGAFAVTAGVGHRGAGRRSSSATTTTTTRSWPRRWPTAWPRRSPSTLHERARRDWGYGQRRAALEGRPDRREVPRHPPGRRLSRPAPTTPRSGRSGTCWTSSRPPGSG